MIRKPGYKLTLYACYLGNVVQACIVNLTPVLFIPLKEQFSLSYRQLGLLVLVNFVTQFICDFSLGFAADKFGTRRFIIAAPAIAFSGFVLFALSPLLLPANPYIGFIVATVIFSGSGGLLELLLSPTVNALPTENKAASMSFLHSFYAWGQVAVVLLSTLALLLIGRENWQYLFLAWSALPLLNLFMFIRAPLAPAVPEEKRTSIRDIITRPLFILLFFIIVGSGSSEMALSQWSSSFMEKGLNIPKATGDILGMSMFAFMQGVGRVAYGKYGSRHDIVRIMSLGCVLAVICYLAVAFSPVAGVSLAFCALCGLAVSLLWPCTLTLAAESFPYAGTLMFAVLAGGGDSGSSVGPWLIGVVIDAAMSNSTAAALAAALGLSAEQLALRIGIVSGAVFPVFTLICLRIFAGKRKQKSLDLCS